MYKVGAGGGAGLRARRPEEVDGNQREERNRKGDVQLSDAARGEIKEIIIEK